MVLPRVRTIELRRTYGFEEVAIVPGFGVAGVVGMLALAAGALAAWTELGPFWGTVTGAVSIMAAGAGSSCSR